MKKRTVTYPLRLPASLKAAVAEISKEDGTSINQFVTAGGCRENLRHEDRRVFHLARRQSRHQSGTPHSAKARWSTAGTRGPFAVNTAFANLQSEIDTGRWAEVGIHENAVFFGAVMHG